MEYAPGIEEVRLDATFGQRTRTMIIANRLFIVFPTSVTARDTVP